MSAQETTLAGQIRDKEAELDLLAADTREKFKAYKDADSKDLKVGDKTSFGTVAVAPKVSPSGKTATITVDNGRRVFTDRISALGNAMVFTD